MPTLFPPLLKTLSSCCAALVLACAPCTVSAQGAAGAASAPLAASAGPATGIGADGLLNRQYGACMDRFSNSTNDMVRCIAGETQRQDKRLNAAYQAALQVQTPERQKQLQAAQRLWVQFRDANCGFYMDPQGGTLARLSANDCLMTSTAQRARELEGFGPNR